MLDILLIQPPLRDYERTRIISHSNPSNVLSPPLSLCYLAAVLNKENYSVKILDMDVEKLSPSEITLFLGKYQPSVVGISANSFNFTNCLILAKTIKEFNSELPIIFGGYHPTLFPIEVIDDAGRTVSIKTEPQKIVSLAPSNTEILFALSLGNKIVGVTDYCNYPEGALEIPKIGGYKTGIGRIIGYNE